MEELKPCPLCGMPVKVRETKSPDGTITWATVEHGPTVSCGISFIGLQKNVVEKWNHRFAESPIPGKEENEGISVEMSNISDHPIHVSPAHSENNMTKLTLSGAGVRIKKNALLFSRYYSCDDYNVTVALPIKLGSIEEKLYNFAHKCHGDQVRKDGSPYIYHLVEVAALVSHFHSSSLVAFGTAICHDVLEDTYLNDAQLLWDELSLILHNAEMNSLTHLGEIAEIVNNVSRLTDDKKLGRKARKEEAKWRILGSNPTVIAVKVCDIISNFYDTSCVDKGFLKLYCEEKLDFLEQLKFSPASEGLNPQIIDLAFCLVKKAQASIE